MLKQQQFHYQEYRILHEDGTETIATRAECFAPGKAPTKDNPYKQRWYFSPDQKLAVRLPRNKMGEAIYRANDTDLKGVERDTIRARECVGQHSKKMCPITCDKCPHRDYCNLSNKSNNGYGCRKKCEDCSARTSRFHSLDKPIGTDDGGNPITPDYASGEDIESTLAQQDIDREYIENIEFLIHSLKGDEKHLFECLKNKMTNKEIADEFGISVPTVLDRKKQLMAKFTVNRLQKSRKREDKVNDLVHTLSSEDQLLYSYVKQGKPNTQIAKLLGIHRKTVEYRRKKLREKFVRAGLEEYF